MILVRDVFQLEFGKAKDAIAHWENMKKMANESGYGDNSIRILTDLVGNYYTLVIEAEFTSLTEYENKAKSLMELKEWKDWYGKFIPMAKSGNREIFKIEN